MPRGFLHGDLPRVGAGGRRWVGGQALAHSLPRMHYFGFPVWRRTLPSTASLCPALAVCPLSACAGTVASVTSPLERLPEPCAPGGRPELPQPCAPVFASSKPYCNGRSARDLSRWCNSQHRRASGGSCCPSRRARRCTTPAMDCTAASAAVDWFTGVQGGHAFPTRLSADL
jgi:hypothetical protein